MTDDQIKKFRRLRRICDRNRRGMSYDSDTRELNYNENGEIVLQSDSDRLRSLIEEVMIDWSNNRICDPPIVIDEKDIDSVKGVHIPS